MLSTFHFITFAQFARGHPKIDAHRSCPIGSLVARNKKVEFSTFGARKIEVEFSTFGVTRNIVTRNISRHLDPASDLNVEFSTLKSGFSAVSDFRQFPESRGLLLLSTLRAPRKVRFSDILVDGV